MLGVKGHSYDPIVSILDKSASSNEIWIELELPNDLLVQYTCYFSWHAPVFLYPSCFFSEDSWENVLPLFSAWQKISSSSAFFFLF